ncbi:cytochrome b5 reductase 4 [Metopolophium dirhodum]|uniref:cytochrome b5 reductase 4 n=1 Tax=Metopolophium dirhodum TaxID=44670 RepID=UPI00298F82BC|nr:cytochrome b5 reductase 4 [Metopolophium dirhodum]
MATGTTRNKVALAPGHSLMDWIRLGNSGSDLTGVGGKMLSISKSELAKHNKRTDAWLAIRGTVYNVTQYMDFHPGGVDELVRGIGTDATKLFSEIHAWVNYESILQKCVVGRLVNEELFKLPDILKAATDVPESDLNMDWFQQLGFLCFVFYTKTPYPEVSITLKQPNEFRFVLNGKTRCITLHKNVNWPCVVKIVADIGKVQVKLIKKVLGLWPTFGIISTTRNIQIDYWKCELLDSFNVTHNTKFLLFKYEHNLYNHIYPGRHIYIKANVNGHVVSRPYTPVVPLVETTEYGKISEDTLCLLVKSYPNGKLSRHLCSLSQGDSIEVSRPQGSFECWTSKTNLILLAAGTGITPMLPIIWNALHSSIKNYNITLLFFNKKETCIIWKKYLDQKSAAYLSRLTVHYILSEEENSKGDTRGHIDENVIIKYFPSLHNDLKNEYAVCICGPSGFNKLCEKLVIQQGYKKDDYFVFG